MSNNNIKITMTLKEKQALENKAKAGWRCFFTMKERCEDLIAKIQEQRGEMVEQMRIVNNNEDIDLTHLKKLFVEMFEKTGGLCQTECPICYENLNKQNTYVGHCGHLVCNNCKPELHGKCPQCRKQF